MDTWKFKDYPLILTATTGTGDLDLYTYPSSGVSYGYATPCACNMNSNASKSTRKELDYGSIFRNLIIIKSINIIVPNKVVEVEFVTGEKYKAVCHESDTFSLERAIDICTLKYLFNGSGSYNKYMRDALKIYNKQLEDEEKKKQAEELSKKKKAKYEAYKKRKAEKKKAAEIAEKIMIQKEAYVQALKEISGTTCDSVVDNNVTN